MLHRRLILSVTQYFSQNVFAEKKSPASPEATDLFW